MTRTGVGLALLLTAACGSAPAPGNPPPTIRIATGPAGGTYLRLGEALARLYTRELPGVRASAEASEGSVSNVRALLDRRADLVFAQADVAYDAYTKDSSVRAVAALYTNALQVITRGDGPVRHLRGLAGRRVGVGPIGSGTERAAEIAMTAHGIGGTRVDRRALSFEEAASLVARGELEAAFVMASFPTDVIARTRGLRLLPVDPAVVNGIRTAHPFYRPLVIPGGTYAGQTVDVPTLGVDNVLACRADLDEKVAQDLTRVLLESLRELAEAHPSAGTIDPEEASAAPIPLHPGAKRYYRTRELFR